MPRLRLPDMEQLIQRGLKSRTDIALFLMNANSFFIAGRIIWKYEILVYMDADSVLFSRSLVQMVVSFLLIYLPARLALARGWSMLNWGHCIIFLIAALAYSQVDNPYFLSPILAGVAFAAHRLKKPFVFIAWVSALLGFFYMGVKPYGTTANLIGYFSYSFVLTLFGSVFFYLMARLLLQQGEQNEKLQAALLEREEFRALEIRNLALEERAHLSRELHDTLGHNLTVVRLQTQIAYKLAQKSEASDLKLVESLSDAVEHGKEALQRLQEVVSALRHSDLEGKLVDTMRQTLGQWPGQVSFEVTGTEPELPHAHRLALLRAFQESLTNAYKYAYGEALTLRLTFEGGEQPQATFSASNPLRADHTGQEFAGEFSRGGLGLDGLRLRFGKLGGEVQVECTASTFGVVYTLPLPASLTGNSAMAEAVYSPSELSSAASPSPSSSKLRSTP